MGILIITLIWLAGTCLRIYRMARFYQIEEYMSLRFLRWVLPSANAGCRLVRWRRVSSAPVSA